MAIILVLCLLFGIVYVFLCIGAACSIANELPYDSRGWELPCSFLLTFAFLLLPPAIIYTILDYWWSL